MVSKSPRAPSTGGSAEGGGGFIETQFYRKNGCRGRVPRPTGGVERNSVVIVTTPRRVAPPPCRGGDKSLVPPPQGAPPKAVGVVSKCNFIDRTDVGDGFPVPREAKRLPYGVERYSVVIEAVRVGTKVLPCALLVQNQVPAQPLRSLGSATGSAPLRPPGALRHPPVKGGQGPRAPFTGGSAEGGGGWSDK